MSIYYEVIDKSIYLINFNNFSKEYLRGLFKEYVELYNKTPSMKVIVDATEVSYNPSKDTTKFIMKNLKKLRKPAKEDKMAIVVDDDSDMKSTAQDLFQRTGRSQTRIVNSYEEAQNFLID